MSIKTIYTCDKCGNEQATQEQFWTVGVTANCGLNAHKYFVAGMSMQVCRPCLESLGIYAQKREDEPDAPKPPTLEELIIEIVRNHTS